jgi:hypothetical protein
MKLSHIIVAWRMPGDHFDRETVYPVSELGEGVARQRAAARVAAVKADNSTITLYEAWYEDGSHKAL